MNSNSTNCKSSSAFGIPSNTLLRYAKDLSWLILTSAAKALRLQVWSLSPSRNVAIRSGASGMRLSECWKMEATAKTAFFRTYACRCSRQDRAEERRGSISSASRSLHRKRNVLPRMYSLGCCRSFLMPLLHKNQLVPFSNAVASLTRPRSSPVLISRWRRVLGIFRSRSKVAS